MDFVEAAIEAASERRTKPNTLSKDEDRPLVVLSYAQSLDGCIGAKDNSQPLRLSGPESMRLTHCIRARCDAVLVGSGTVKNDDPRLSVRLDNHPPSVQPRPVVLDSRLSAVSPKSNVVTLNNRLIVFCQYLDSDPEYSTLQSKRAALESLKVAVVNLVNMHDLPNHLRPTSVSDVSSIPIPLMLRVLKSKFGVNSLMVEGGSRIISAFLGLGSLYVDCLIVTVAPMFVGSGGVKAFDSGSEGADEARKGQSVALQVVDPVYRQFGPDIVFYGSLN
ncbi:2,5-diamino-6-(ribosylamino)-4(3H)-pyrimidinone 5'-phosphate reductase [Chytriomyces hyalinus]|nr:2,5-diamino-6-(ribosylamino)-4(3H)-pyrimidinone 5'-phosphate reductase [Chytriomyces hyalinus]